MVARQTGQESRTVQTQRHGSHSGAPFYNCGATLALSSQLVEEVFNTLIDPYKKGDLMSPFSVRRL
jgi:hypothetical protein